jgi:hypothetical protein
LPDAAQITGSLALFAMVAAFTWLECLPMCGKRRKKQRRQKAREEERSRQVEQPQRAAPPASESSSPPFEIYVTVIVAIISAVVPMNDMLRCLLIMVAFGSAVDLCWRYPRMAVRKTWIKAALTVVAVAAGLAIDYRIVEKPRTYIYLLPTREMTNDAVRIFFIRESGPDVLHHVRLSL